MTEVKQEAQIKGFHLKTEYSSNISLTDEKTHEVDSDRPPDSSCSARTMATLG